MNNPLLSPSLAQQEYLADQLRRRSMIRIWRILLLILILSLWELSASLGLIDRFIFGSHRNQAFEDQAWTAENKPVDET